MIGENKLVLPFMHAYNRHLQNTMCKNPKSKRERGKDPIRVSYAPSKGKRVEPSQRDLAIYDLMMRIIKNFEPLPKTPFRLHLIRNAYDAILATKGLSDIEMKKRLSTPSVPASQHFELLYHVSSTFNDLQTPLVKVGGFVDFLEACKKSGTKDFRHSDWAGLQIARAWPEGLTPPFSMVKNKSFPEPPKVENDDSLRSALVLLYVSASLPAAGERYAILAEMIRCIKKNCELTREVRQYLRLFENKLVSSQSIKCDMKMPVTRDAFDRLEQYATGKRPIYNFHAFLLEIKELTVCALSFLADRRFSTEEVLGISSKRAAPEDLPLTIKAKEREDFASVAPNRIFSQFDQLVMMDLDDREDQLDYVVAYVAASAHPSLGALKEAAERKIRQYKLEQYVHLANQYTSDYVPENTSIRTIEFLINLLENGGNLENKLRCKIDLSVAQCHLAEFTHSEFVKPAFMKNSQMTSGACSLEADSDYAVFYNILFGFYQTLFDPENSTYQSISCGKLKDEADSWAMGITLPYTLASDEKSLGVATYKSLISQKRPDICWDDFVPHLIHYLELAGMTDHITRIPVTDETDLSEWTQEDFNALPGTAMRRGLFFHNTDCWFVPTDTLGDYSLKFLVYAIENRHMLLTRDADNRWHLFDPAGDLGFGYPTDAKLRYVGQGSYEAILGNSGEISAAEIHSGFVGALYA